MQPTNSNQNSVERSARQAVPGSAARAGGKPPRAVDGEARLRAASERMMLTRQFGEQMREMRIAAGLSRSQLARRSRVSVATIRKAELGQGGEPGLVLILTVSSGLRVQPGELLGKLPVPVERRP